MNTLSTIQAAIAAAVISVAAVNVAKAEDHAQMVASLEADAKVAATKAADHERMALESRRSTRKGEAAAMQAHCARLVKQYRTEEARLKAEAAQHAAM
jgi:hypothetical protein